MIRQPAVAPQVEDVTGAGSKKAKCEQDQDWSLKA